MAEHKTIHVLEALESTRPLMTAFARKPGTANRFGPGAGDSVH